MDHIDAWIDNLAEKFGPDQNRWLIILRVSAPSIEYVDRLLARRLFDPQFPPSFELVSPQAQMWSRFGSKAFQSFLRAGRDPLLMAPGTPSASTDLSSILLYQSPTALKAVRAYLKNTNAPCFKDASGEWYPLAFACRHATLPMVMEMCKIFPWKATPDQEKQAFLALMSCMLSKPIDRYCLNIIWDKVNSSISDETFHDTVRHFKNKHYDQSHLWEVFRKSRSLDDFSVLSLAHAKPQPSANPSSPEGGDEEKSQPSPKVHPAQNVPTETLLPPLVKKGDVLECFYRACSSGSVKELTDRVSLENIASFQHPKGKSLLELSISHPKVFMELIKICDPKQVDSEGRNVLFHLTNSFVNGFSHGFCLSKKKMEMLRSSIKRVDINHQDRLGNTVLMHLWKNNVSFENAIFLEVFEELCKKNPDFSIENHEGKTLESMMQSSFSLPSMSSGTKSMMLEKLSVWMKKDLMSMLCVDALPSDPPPRRKI